MIEFRGLARRYWRIPVVAFLGAVLAFVASFAIPKQYASGTRLLVRARSTTFLTDSGDDLSKQPGVIDATLAKALGQTQGALLATRTVAEMVVDELNLDERPAETASGPIGAVRNALTGVYKRTRAILTHGYYKEPALREGAVDAVFAGLSAVPLKDSYVLDLIALADDPVLAANIANAAADALVAVSTARFKEEAERQRDFLSTQRLRAEEQSNAAEAALRDFKQSHNVSDVALQIELNAKAADDVATQARDTAVALRSNRAALASVERSLKTAPPTAVGTNDIETGRSTTRIEMTSPDSTYQSLVIKRDGLMAEIASLEARQAGLDQLINPDASSLSDEEAELQRLQLAVSTANDTFREVNTQFEAALLNSQSVPVELSRVDRASPSLYPVKPVRYLYAIMGLLSGALLALGLTVLRERRRAPGPPMGPGPVAPSPPGVHQPVPDPVPATVGVVPVKAVPNGTAAKGLAAVAVPTMLVWLVSRRRAR